MNWFMLSPLEPPDPLEKASLSPLMCDCDLLMRAGDPVFDPACNWEWCRDTALEGGEGVGTWDPREILLACSSMVSSPGLGP